MSKGAAKKEGMEGVDRSVVFLSSSSHGSINMYTRRRARYRGDGGDVATACFINKAPLSRSPMGDPAT